MRILLADDHGLFRGGMRYLLTGLQPDTSIVEVATLTELNAIDFARFDLILMDLSFESKTSFPLIQVIRQEAPMTRLIIVSGDDSPQRIRDCIEAGALGFLPKSEDNETLLPALRLVLAGGVYLPAKAIQSMPEVSDEAITHPKMGGLSERQREILELAVLGTPNKLIGRKLNIAEGTVKAHLSKIYQTIGARNRTEAVYILAGEARAKATL
jgi:DNA-binding NarL/FixJ family response regulator